MTLGTYSLADLARAAAGDRNFTVIDRGGNTLRSFFQHQGQIVYTVVIDGNPVPVAGVPSKRIQIQD